MLRNDRCCGRGGLWTAAGSLRSPAALFLGPAAERRRYVGETRCISLERDDIAYLTELAEENARARCTLGYLATNPLFSKPGGRRECTASCVLLAVGERVVLVTSSHALQSGGRQEFGAQDQILPIVGHIRRTLPASDRDTDQDSVDLAVVLLHPDVAAAIDRSILVPPTLLDTLERPEPPLSYLAIGYPYTRQRSHRISSENAATAHGLLLTRQPLAAYANIGLDPLGTAIVGFDKKRMFRRGEQVVSPDPIGMSGGSLWALPGFPSPHAEGARLAGILIQWNRGAAKQIIATRAHVIYQMLKELDPSLAEHYPNWSFGCST